MWALAIMHQNDYRWGGLTKNPARGTFPIGFAPTLHSLNLYGLAPMGWPCTPVKIKFSPDFDSS